VSWQQARADAELRLRPLLDQIEATEADPRKTRIALGVIADKKTLDYLEPGCGWSLSYHHQVTRASMRILRSKKIRVDMKPVSLADYFFWLGGRADTLDARRDFLVEKLA
jgi:hypothetical protein